MLPASRTLKQLGTELKRYRKRHGLTQAELSSRIGKRQATISKLESEGSSTLGTLFAVLFALDLELAIRPYSKSDVSKLGDIF